MRSESARKSISASFPFLTVTAQIENGLPLACVCERLLAPRHAVLKHYEDAVVPKRRLGLGWAAARRSC